MDPAWRIAFLILPSLAFPAEALAEACGLSDTSGRPLRRAVARVKHLPQTEAWAAQASIQGAVVQYVLSLDKVKRVEGRCYWTVDVRAGGKRWKRFLVTPDGRRVMEDRKS